MNRAARPAAAVLVAGSEITSGRRRDVNGGLLAAELTAAGLAVVEIRAVPDAGPVLAASARECARRAAVVAVCGGLGPTDDDLTRPALAEAAGVELVLDEAALAVLEARLAAHGRTLGKSDRRQAYLPAGARVLANPVGSAPGFLLRIGTAVVFALPGVPAELAAMAATAVAAAASMAGAGGAAPARRVLMVAGLPEASVQDRLDEAGGLAGIELASYPNHGQIALHFSGPDQAAVIAAAARAAELLGEHVFAARDMTIEERVGELLLARQARLALAESCTGGLIGHRLTNVPGSSAYFESGVVVYSNRSKTEILDVPPELIEAHGAVSRPVAEAMAEGIRQRAGADYGLAVTGVAGPGASECKPPGTVHVAVAGPSARRWSQLALPGTRRVVKEIAATLALDQLRRLLLEDGA